MLVWLTLPFYDFCGFRSVAVNSVYKLQFFLHLSLVSPASQAKRDIQLTARLRCARQYSTIYARTNRYKNSLIVYGLNHWQ